MFGLKYKPLFSYFNNKENAFKIVPADFVTEGEGTAIVHLAPGLVKMTMRSVKKKI